MTLTAEIDEATLTVLLDLRHPFSYLALHPVFAFGEETGAEIDWLPVCAQTLNPPSEPRPGDDRGIRHRRSRAQMIAREIEIYSEAQGLVLRDFYRDGPAEVANLGWLFVRDRRPDLLEPYLSELFRGYWALELDPASVDDVATLVAATGADGEAFRAFAQAGGPSAAAALADELRERGLAQSPVFLIEDEVFVGRQHLPMIRWILEGRSGRVPI